MNQPKKAPKVASGTAESLQKQIERYKNELLKYAAVAKNSEKISVVSTPQSEISENMSLLKAKTAKHEVAITEEPQTYAQETSVKSAVSPVISEPLSQPKIPEILQSDPKSPVLQPSMSTMLPEIPPVILKPPMQPELPPMEEEPEESGATGNLIVQVFGAQQAFPIEDATISISREKNGETELIGFFQTDESGKIPLLELDAPAFSYSQRPSEFLPYSTYTVSVRHPGYYSTTIFGVQIYPGLTSIQNVNMVPLPSGSSNEKGRDIIIGGNAMDES